MDGQAIQRAIEAYTKFMKVLIAIASLQTQFVTLNIALKVKINDRVNTLEFILIPKIYFVCNQLLPKKVSHSN